MPFIQHKMTLAAMALPSMPKAVIEQPSKEEVKEQVVKAQSLKIDMEAVPILLLSFFLGSFTGLLMLLRYGKSMRAYEIVSSALLSGSIALMVNSYLITKNLGWQAALSISVACGLGGDGMVRGFGRIIATSGSGMLTAFMSVARKFINPELFKKDDSNKKE